MIKFFFNYVIVLLLELVECCNNRFKKNFSGFELLKFYFVRKKMEKIKVKLF